MQKNRMKVTSEVRRFFCNAPRGLFNYFVNGLIIIIPLAITIWVLVWVFGMVDGILGPLLTRVFGRPIPGLGFVIIIALIVMIGYLGITFGRRKIFNLFETSVMKIPVVGTIYGSARQIIDSFSPSSTSKFLEVVLMEFPRKGTYTVGLVTSTAKDKNGKNILNIFIPTAPNPAGGFLQIVPESDVIKTSISVNDALKLIISVGKVSPDNIADMLIEAKDLEIKDSFLKT